MVGFNPSNRSAADTILPRAKESGVGTIGMFAVRGMMNPRSDRAATSGLAYRYSRQAGIDVVLTGTSSPEHLKQNVAAVLGPPLSPELLERLGG